MGTDDLGVLTEKVPIGKWVANAIEFIKDNFFHELRAFSGGLDWVLDGLRLLPRPDPAAGLHLPRWRPSPFICTAAWCS